MPTFSVKRRFKSGKLSAVSLMFIKADNEDHAWTIFDRSERWAAYPETTSFEMIEIPDIISDPLTDEQSGEVRD